MRIMVRKKILIVDDEWDIIKAVTIRLQTNGYEVISALNWAQGISMVHKEMPDLVILDVRMPSGNGFSVVENLKQSDRTDRIPIIFLTGSPERNTEERAIKVGARFYIKKPYDSEELLDAVKRALERKPTDG
jgi:DNA-binding response OmpR family regulator